MVEDIRELTQEVQQQVKREMGRELRGCVKHRFSGSSRIFADQILSGVLVHGVPARRCKRCGHTLFAADLLAAIEALVMSLTREKGIDELELINHLPQ